MHRKIRFLGPAVLGLTCLIAVSLPTVIQAEEAKIPSVITFCGTRYVDCRADPDYPFATTEKTTVLHGVVTEDCGSKMYPWFAAVVAGRTLFAAHTKDLLCNYGDMLGKEVEITGYPGAGSITVTGSIFGDSIEEFPKAFFVSRINGWLHVCGYPVNEDTGKASETLSYFWVSLPVGT